MANAKICDRCGALFTEKEKLINIDFSNAPLSTNLLSFTKKQAEGHIFYKYRFVLQKADLCEKCLLSLSEWFEEGGGE